MVWFEFSPSKKEPIKTMIHIFKTNEKNLYNSSFFSVFFSSFFSPSNVIPEI